MTTHTPRTRKRTGATTAVAHYLRTGCIPPGSARDVARAIRRGRAACGGAADGE